MPGCATKGAIQSRVAVVTGKRLGGNIKPQDCGFVCGTKLTMQVRLFPRSEDAIEGRRTVQGGNGAVERADLIAGEEPELCVRLRAAGWRYNFQRLERAQ
jgi:hypothetical protein